MKTLITLVFTVLFSTLCLAQNGINYKAIIKDVNGNVLVSSPVSIQFIIYEGAALTNNVYQESHTLNTDANGLVIVNIGEGTTANVFTNINWTNDDHFLNTKINTGAGLVNMGTTEFKTVPYAKNAETATVAANVTGLEALNETNGIGWRLKGRDPNNYGNIGLNAVDLSYSSIVSTAKGARGFGSMAIGLNVEAEGNYSFSQGGATKASGLYAVALGFSTVASGAQSTAMGGFTSALGSFSTAFGRDTSASGLYSTSFGFNTISDDSYTTVIGKYNDNTTSSTSLFQVGNGTSISNRSNALSVLDNGTITAPSFDLAEITDSKALITKEYADTNLGAKGLEPINEGNGIGWRLKGRNPSYYGSIGLSAVDLSYSGAASYTNGARGDYSIAMGENTTSSGQNSIAMGFNTTASSYASLAIGKYNVGGGSATSWVGTDPVFEIGYGSYIGFPVNGIFRLNSFTVLKNGMVGIGTNTPTTFLQLTNGYDAHLGNIDSGYFMIGRDTGANLLFDNNEIMARNNGATSPLYLQQDGGNVYVGGALVHSSDRRLKKDITPLSYGLETILKLNPVAYNWKNRVQDHKSLGLIAQEVQPIISEVVSVADDEAKTLGVSYTELIPVLIKAIQEQQEIIDKQAGTINNQNSKINTLTAELDQLKTLDTRVKQLESLINTLNQ